MLAVIHAPLEATCKEAQGQVQALLVGECQAISNIRWWKNFTSSSGLPFTYAEEIEDMLYFEELFRAVAHTLDYEDHELFPANT